MIDITDVVTYELSLSSSEGPELSAADHFDSEAVEKIEVVAPKNSVPINVNVALMGITSLFITASDYSGDLSFSVNELGAPITLNGPLMLIGEGALALLAIGITDLVFTNADATVDANVTIMVTRDAVV